MYGTTPPAGQRPLALLRAVPRLTRQVLERLHSESSTTTPSHVGAKRPCPSPMPSSSQRTSPSAHPSDCGRAVDRALIPTRDGGSRPFQEVCGGGSPPLSQNSSFATCRSGRSSEGPRAFQAVRSQASQARKVAKARKSTRRSAQHLTSPSFAWRRIHSLEPCLYAACEGELQDATSGLLGVRGALGQTGSSTTGRDIERIFSSYTERGATWARS